jgi:hypothetical protein
MGVAFNQVAVWLPVGTVVGLIIGIVIGNRNRTGR